MTSNKAARRFAREYHRRTGKNLTLKAAREAMRVVAETQREVDEIMSRARRPPWWRVVWVWVMGTFKLWRGGRPLRNHE